MTLPRYRTGASMRYIGGGESVTHVLDWIEFAAVGIEILAVGIMLGVIIIGTWRWLAQSAKQVKAGYQRYRVLLGKALSVGLELLVAADIIRTVVIESTLENMAVLGSLVVIRTFLGWSLSIEIEGRWPWQGKNQTTTVDEGAGSG